MLRNAQQGAVIAERARATLVIERQPKIIDQIARSSASSSKPKPGPLPGAMTAPPAPGWFQAPTMSWADAGGAPTMHTAAAKQKAVN